MKMNYFILGTNNMEASTRFYDALFEQTALSQVLANERMTFWQGEIKTRHLPSLFPSMKHLRPMAMVA